METRVLINVIVATTAEVLAILCKTVGFHLHLFVGHNIKWTVWASINSKEIIIVILAYANLQLLLWPKFNRPPRSPYKRLPKSISRQTLDRIKLRYVLYLILGQTATWWVNASILQTSNTSVCFVNKMSQQHRLMERAQLLSDRSRLTFRWSKLCCLCH